jgi:hypothetical protein
MKGDFLKISDAWKKFATPPPFPTYLPDAEETIPEDLYADYIQPFNEASITFEVKSVKKGR